MADEEAVTKAQPFRFREDKKDSDISDPIHLEAVLAEKSIQDVEITDSFDFDITISEEILVDETDDFVAPVRHNNVAKAGSLELASTGSTIDLAASGEEVVDKELPTPSVDMKSRSDIEFVQESVARKDIDIIIEQPIVESVKSEQPATITIPAPEGIAVLDIVTEAAAVTEDATDEADNGAQLETLVDELFDDLLVDAIQCFRSIEKETSCFETALTVETSDIPAQKISTVEVTVREVAKVSIVQRADSSLRQLLNVFLQSIPEQKDGMALIPNDVYGRVVTSMDPIDDTSCRLVFDCINEAISVVSAAQSMRFASQYKPMSIPELRDQVSKLLREWNANADHENTAQYLVVQEIKQEERVWSELTKQEALVQDNIVELLWEELVGDMASVLSSMSMSQDSAFSMQTVAVL